MAAINHLWGQVRWTEGNSSQDAERAAIAEDGFNAMVLGVNTLVQIQIISQPNNFGGGAPPTNFAVADWQGMGTGKCKKQ